MAIGRSQIEQLLKGAATISKKANKNKYDPLKAIANLPKGVNMVMRGNVAKKINYGKKGNFKEQGNRNGKRDV